jgi:RHS repeat-associated protein
MSTFKHPRRFVAATLLAALGVGSLPTVARAEVVEYYHLDALGSVRMVTNASGAVSETHDYLPYGEEWCPNQTPSPGVCVTPPAGQPRRFTGKERDTETALDYFGARYYGARIGRFTTIDPLITQTENTLDPQRWNRFSYGRNNPLRYIDPDGREVFTQTEVMGAGLDYQRGLISHQDLAIHFEGSGNLMGGLLVATVWGAVIAPELMPFAYGVVAVPANQQIALEFVEGVAGVPSSGVGAVSRNTRSITDRLIQHTTRKDLVGAAREVATGVAHGGQHLKEVREAARGLRVRINQIMRGLSNPKLAAEQRQALTQELSVASKNLDAAEQALEGRYIQHDNR